MDIFILVLVLGFLILVSGILFLLAVYQITWMLFGDIIQHEMKVNNWKRKVDLNQIHDEIDQELGLIFKGDQKK